MTYIRLIFTGLLLLFATGWGQAATFTGVVTDSITGEELPFISIRIADTMYGDETDIDGKFSLQANPDDKLIFTFLGYQTKTVPLRKHPNGNLQVKLVPTDFQLEEIQITSKHSYSKKNNPAVDLIRRVIDNKKGNRIESANYYQRNTYEKTVLGLLDISSKRTGALGLSEIAKQSDSSIISGKSILLLSMKEKAMEQYYRKSPKAKKQVVTGKHDQGIDEEVLAEGWLSSFMEEVFADIDIYNSDISIGMKPFVSPLSPIAPDFYKFFIQDTTYIDGHRCINLGFAPFNSANFGFMGFLSIDDSTLAVKHVSIDVPKNTNINYINGMHIEQSFQYDAQGYMELTDEELTTEFYIIRGTQGVYAKRIRNFSNYVFNQPNDSILQSFPGKELVMRTATEQDSTFWIAHRSDTLKLSESKMTHVLDKLQKHPVVKSILFVAELLIKGYYRTGKPSKFDIGPVYTMISGNEIEGLRLKMVGETTANLNPHLFASGYMAYGFKDQRVKYNGVLEYSFIEKSYHPREYPMNAVQVSYTNDIRTLGEQPSGTLADNLFYSIKRMPVTNMMYYKQAKLMYIYEHRSGFSLQPWMQYELQEGAGTIHFDRVQHPNDTLTLPYLHNPEIGIKLRYAPNEKFIQGRITRFNLKNPHPVFELTHRASFANLLHSEYGYQTTELKYLQRFFLSAFGRIDLTVKAGKIWTGGVAYPYLFSPNANTSFTVMEESFSQVNPLEFIADQYLSLDVGLNTQILFNYIPGVKKLQLREVFGFKCYWGYLSDKNNPYIANGLLVLPTNSYPMTMQEPYMEFSVGIDNIFHILRVDYVRRINYLDHPNIWANGVRVSLNFTF